MAISCYNNYKPESVIRHAESVSDREDEALGLLASVRILFLATPRRSPLRLRPDENHVAWHKWHKRTIFQKPNDRLGIGIKDAGFPTP